MNKILKSTILFASLTQVLTACVFPNTNTSLSLGDPAAPAVSCSTACNTALLDVSKEFNVFVFQDYSAPSSDAQGRIAAGRDVSIGNYSVGDSLSPDTSRYDIIAGRNINFISGDVPNGGIAYGNNFSGSGTSLSSPIQASPIAFNAARVQLEGISDSLASLPTNQTPTITYTGSRSFVNLDANQVQNIYSMTSSDLANIHTFTIIGSSSASVIINVTGASASITDFSMNYSGGITRDHILFNFNQATTLSLGEISIEGTLLAPHADVTFPTGMLNGQLVANSFTGAGQFNYSPFNGCLPVVSSLNYFKDSFNDSTDGYALGGTPYEMYGMAVKQVGDYIIVGVNTNFALAGEMYSGSHIGWGDFVMNFAGNQSSYANATPATSYAVKFVNGTASDSVNSSLGLYQNAIIQGVESSHYGWNTWNDYQSWVFGHGSTDPLLAGIANSYFVGTSSVPNSIQSGTFVSGTGFQILNQSELSALGIDFTAGLSTSSSVLGSVTFGFSFKRTASMTGNFTAHLAMECANDVVAFPGTLEASCH